MERIRRYSAGAFVASTSMSGRVPKELNDPNGTEMDKQARTPQLPEGPRSGDNLHWREWKRAITDRHYEMGLDLSGFALKVAKNVRPRAEDNRGIPQNG